MNTEVEIHVGAGTCARVPNAALRTQRDVNSAAQVLGSIRPGTAAARGGGRSRNAHQP